MTPNYKQSAIPSRAPRGNALVLDGNEVKFRLMAERAESKSVVHVDWVRFTAQRRNVLSSGDFLGPRAWDKPEYTTWLGVPKVMLSSDEFKRVLLELEDCDKAAPSQALELAQDVCAALGSDFVVAPDVRKGQDFYKFRWAIERNGSECGWVGFLASGDSPRQSAQSRTIHANIYGAACTFAASGWADRIADIVDEHSADLTRCDLALDFFDGIPGGLDFIVDQYKSGACDVGGRRVKSSCIGDWFDKKRGRSFYLGSKEAGKQTNCYEKGDQLFGIGGGSDWLRIELRYGNKLRVLPSDMLRRPADYFADASDWHQGMLLLADVIVTPQPLPCLPRLQIDTVKAECVRSVRWLKNTAAASVAVAFEHLGLDEFLSIVMNQKLPGRLAKFKRSEIAAQMAPALALVAPFSLRAVPGTDATFSVECAPAFA
ncbi:replication initiation factor domain-containing protein [Rhodoferax sp.]|uniref:replication initiation factor domain-containing protein n=1 Tax=Rhodoferax sp. TaxID=50421 RepID=UPI0027235E0B|nr:replication initiation factor domain-containing protein [Rhodoferax sp.]MDO9195869.1 replication initiation factor domain-containing protein [Rhodoferax sp.]